MGCSCVYTLKYRPDGSVDRHKTRVVVKGYTQTYDVDYFVTSSPAARLNSIKILFFYCCQSVVALAPVGHHECLLV